MVMGGPALVLLVIIAAACLILPRSVFRRPSATESAKNSFRFSQIHELLRVRQFWIVCALSFTLTLMRETFNTWTVDFFKTEEARKFLRALRLFFQRPLMRLDPSELFFSAGSSDALAGMPGNVCSS